METTFQRNIVTLENEESLFFKIRRFLICFFFFISFFEPYLNGIIGSITKYYIILLISFLALTSSNVKFFRFHFCFVFWLLLKMLSILWASNTYVMEMELFSQIGMVLLLVFLTCGTLDKKTIVAIVKTLLLGSFIIGLLSLFFSNPYHGVVSERQVLVLFGQESDPNNQAAFLLIGIAISLFCLMVERKRKTIYLPIVLINTYALFLTGSRGGLIGLISLIIFSLAVGLKSSIKQKITTILLITVLSIIVVYFAWLWLPRETFDRLFAFTNYEGGSERDLLWSNALSLISKDANWLFGAGWGSYYGYNDYYHVLHNTFLSIFCDVGLVGFLLFFVPLFIVCKYLAKHKQTLPLFILIAGLVPSFFLEAVSKRFFWNVIFFALICYVYQNSKNSFNENKETL